MKRKGEFKQSGSSDVLTAALETPEHSGRVRGVGSFVSPSTFFNMPKGKRTRVTKDELLARDKKREEEFERRTQEFDKKTENLMNEIAELKALITTSNLHSPMLSDKASCREDKEQQLGKEMKIMCKPVAAKALMAEIEGEDDCVYIDPIASSAPEIKVNKVYTYICTMQGCFCYNLTYNCKCRVRANVSWPWTELITR